MQKNNLYAKKNNLEKLVYKKQIHKNTVGGHNAQQQKKKNKKIYANKRHN